jgi:hypothetical protein
MPVFTKDDLVAAFSAECFAMDARLNAFASADYAVGYCKMINLLDATAMPDPEQTWWSGGNYSRLLKQWYAIEQGLGEDEYQEIFQDAQAQLQMGDGHLDQFHQLKHGIEKEDPKDPSYYKFLPHQVGWNGQAYGQELHQSDGWKSVEMTCAALPHTQASIQFVNNPQVARLGESFMFAVLLESTDREPLAPKINAAQSRGLIRACH